MNLISHKYEMPPKNVWLSQAIVYIIHQLMIVISCKCMYSTCTFVT